jgi:MinD-like ATPase involved in chromosome partitioning or flagellar assembly
MNVAKASSVVYVCAARPDGATTVTIGLSGVAAAESRVLAVDANVQRAELAALLNLDETPSIYELAYQSRLSPVGADALESHVQWRDGVGVLPGVASQDEGEEVSGPFMEGLLARAAHT